METITFILLTTESDEEAMDNQTEELKMLLSRFPLDATEVCEPFFQEKWAEYSLEGFDTAGMDCSINLSTNVESVRVNVSNMKRTIIEWSHHNIEFAMDYETIHEYSYPAFTTFNLLMDSLSDYIEFYKSGNGYTYSEIPDENNGDGAIDMIFLADNIKYIVEDICKQDSFSLEQYLRYTACISPTIKAFHSFDILKPIDIKPTIEIKNAVEEIVHKKADEGMRIVSSIENLLDGIHNMLLLLAVNRQVIRKCAICGKYFVPANKSDEIYCRFPNDALNGKTCKEESKKLKQYETEAAKGEEFKLAKNIYNRLLNADKRRNYTSNKTEFTESSKFRELNQEKKADVQQGTISLEQYVQWLKEYDAATRKR